MSKSSGEFLAPPRRAVHVTVISQLDMRRAAALRACCGEGGCYRRRHLRLLNEAPRPLARSLMAELAACDEGLAREDFVRMIRKLSIRNHGRLAMQALDEMESRGMRPSVSAYNALLISTARAGAWGESLLLLMRMQQRSIKPDLQSYLLTIRAASHGPGASQLTAALLPEMEATAPGLLPSLPPSVAALLPASVRAELADVGGKAGAAEVGGKMGGRAASPPAARSAAPAAHAPRTRGRSARRGSSPSRDEGHGTPSAQAIGALIGAASVDDGRRTGRGLRLLQETLARGAVEPSAGTFLAALRGCTRYPDRWQEAMQVLTPVPHIPRP